MAYTLITPWLNQTYGIDDSNRFAPYARLAGKEFNGGTVNGNIPVSLTDIPRGVSLLINGTTASSTWINQGNMNFTGTEITPMATGVFDYLTKIGIENEVVDTQLGYGQDIDNLEIEINKSDLPRIK